MYNMASGNYELAEAIIYPGYNMAWPWLL